MKTTLGAAEAQAILDRTLSVVELNPDIPFLSMSVEAPGNDEVPRAILNVASPDKDTNEQAVNRVLQMLGGGAVEGALNEEVIPYFSGTVRMPDLLMQVSSAASFSAMSKYRPPSRATLERARTFGSFVRGLALPVQLARIGLFPTGMGSITGEYTSQSEYEHLQNILDGTIVNSREVRDAERVMRDESMNYDFVLPSDIRILMRIYDATPEYKAMMDRMRRKRRRRHLGLDDIPE